MFELSVTLIVQMVNFLISWLMIDRLLLRPFVGEIFKERAYKKEKNDILIDQEHQLHKVRVLQEIQRKEIQERFSCIFPLIDKETSSIHITELPFTLTQVCDIHEQELLTHQTVTILTKRITDDGI